MLLSTMRVPLPASFLGAVTRTRDFFGPLVHAEGLVWIRGEPKLFASSNKVSRGFCGECGTPLTFDYGKLEIAIGSLDNPELAPPTIQVNPADRLSFFETMQEIPVRGPEDEPGIAEFMADIVSHQHPDHDTEQWPQKGGESP